MGVPVPEQASHAPYIDAVIRLLREQDVDTGQVRVDGREGLRSAALRLRPDATAFAADVPAEALLTWDEENGWALGSRPDLAAPAAVSTTYKGLGVLPDPEDVAAWVVVLLTHPELTPSREDHLFRDRSVPEPAFEAELARYSLHG